QNSMRKETYERQRAADDGRNRAAVPEPETRILSRPRRRLLAPWFRLHARVVHGAEDVRGGHLRTVHRHLAAQHVEGEMIPTANNRGDLALQDCYFLSTVHASNFEFQDLHRSLRNTISFKPNSARLVD